MPNEGKPPVETLVTGCKLTREELREALRGFLGKYGDELPEKAIEHAVSDEVLDNWIVYCDPKDPKVPIAGVHYENNDWYLCTLKNAAVRTEDRRKGIGGKMYGEVAKKAMADRKCLVIAGDITYDNVAPIKLVERLGFKRVNRFCWGPGEKPADIIHFVKFPPEGTECK